MVLGVQILKHFRVCYFLCDFLYTSLDARVFRTGSTSKGEEFFLLELSPSRKGHKYENGRVASHESVTELHKL